MTFCLAIRFPQLFYVSGNQTCACLCTNTLLTQKFDLRCVSTFDVRIRWPTSTTVKINTINKTDLRGARWLSGRVSDSGDRGLGFETYLRRVVFVSKTLYSPKVLVNYPGSGGSVPTWLKNCWLGHKQTNKNRFIYRIQSNKVSDNNFMWKKED